MTDLVDPLGHLGYVLLLFGTFLIAKGRHIGWLLRFSGSVLWAVLGFVLELSSIYVWSIVFAAIDAFGWLRTKDDEDL